MDPLVKVYPCLCVELCTNMCRSYSCVNSIVEGAHGTWNVVGSNKRPDRMWRTGEIISFLTVVGKSNPCVEKLKEYFIPH